MKSGRAAIMVILLCAACLALPAAAAVYYSASTPQIITKGDTFSVSGTGATNGTVALWVIGRDYFEVRTVAPDRHGNFTILFKSTETAKFSNGQYAIVVQEPGASGTREIESGHDSTGNITIMNRGKIIARLGSETNLKGNVQKETDILTSAAILQGVDDTFQAEYFFVEDPAVHFDEIIPASGSRLPDKVSGNTIRITGTTNMGSEDTLVAEIQNADTNTTVTSKKLPVISGSSLNRWSYVLDEPGLEPGNYLISVGWTATNATGTGTALFSVYGETTPVPPPSPAPMGNNDNEVPLPKGLDTLLILGMIFVFTIIVYTVTKK